MQRPSWFAKIIYEFFWRGSRLDISGPANQGLVLIIALTPAQVSVDTPLFCPKKGNRKLMMSARVLLPFPSPAFSNKAFLH